MSAQIFGQLGIHREWSPGLCCFIDPLKSRLFPNREVTSLSIGSEKAPDQYPWGPKGTLWGWLFPAHETVGANVPQQDLWFIPQLDTPSR